MKSKLVAGYQAVWKEPAPHYDDILQDLPSKVCLSVAIMILNELTANIPFRDNQLRILNILSRKFTENQRNQLLSRLHKLEEGEFKEDAFELFHRRYLIKLLIKETKRNKEIKGFTNATGKPFAFVNAYLAVIDEEAAKDRLVLNEMKYDESNPFWQLQLIWTTSIRQFQFNERLHALFELFKLSCLLNFSKKNWREPLRNYFATVGIRTIGHFCHTYRVIYDAVSVYLPDNLYKRPSILKVDDPQKYPHLASLCINNVFGNTGNSLREIKKHPLFDTEKGAIQVIDPDLFFANIYRTPYFGLKEHVPVKSERDTSYSSIIAKEVIEKTCFKAIMKMLCPPPGVLLFDDQSEHVPDGYYRIGNTIFLIEMKAYTLSDKISEEPNASNISRYIHENFMRKPSGKGKGAGQIINQIENIRNKTFGLDPEIQNCDEKEYTIYPIICHNDIHFSLPGLNTYVNEYFIKELSQESKELFDIKNVTFINLQVLFDLAIKARKFEHLAERIAAYWKLVSHRFRVFESQNNTDNFTRTTTSFDEIYEFEYRHMFGDELSEKKNQLFAEAGITQQVLDEDI